MPYRPVPPPPPPPRVPRTRTAGPPPPPPPPAPGPPWYWQNWFVILALIVVFPVGLVLMWTRRPRWSTGVRWVTSAVVLAVAVPVIASAAAYQPPVGGAEQSAPSVSESGSTNTPTTTPSPTPAATATPVPTPPPTPTPTATPVPTAVPVAPPPPPAPTAAPANLCGAPANPWGYNFCGGSYIYSPNPSFCSYFNCIPSFWESTNGYVDQCVDGTFSHSGGRRGACSYHGGESRPLYS